MFCRREELLIDIMVDRIMAQREQKEQAVEILVDEVVALYHLLRVVVALIHSDANLTAAARGVLRGLDRIGPQTVPQIARARPVSRQYIQAVVNHLGKRRVVELVPNPAHKRSSLVQLTSKAKTGRGRGTERGGLLGGTANRPEREGVATRLVGAAETQGLLPSDFAGRDRW